MQSTTTHTILLIHPLGYSAKHAESDISRMANIMPPLGLASIAAYLESHNIRADIIDCYAHPDSDSLIDEYIKTHHPDFIGFSCTTSSFLTVSELQSGPKVTAQPYVSSLVAFTSPQ